MMERFNCIDYKAVDRAEHWTLEPTRDLLASFASTSLTSCVSSHDIDSIPSRLDQRLYYHGRCVTARSKLFRRRKLTWCSLPLLPFPFLPLSTSSLPLRIIYIAFIYIDEVAALVIDNGR